MSPWYASIIPAHHYAEAQLHHFGLVPVRHVLKQNQSLELEYYAPTSTFTLDLSPQPATVVEGFTGIPD